jgi:Acetyl-CoA carboxylase, central region
MRDANLGDLASLVQVSASHVHVKVTNGMVVTFIAGSLRSVSHKQAGRRFTSCWEVQARLQKLCQLFAPSFAVIALSARTVLADLNRPQVYHRHSTVGRLLADMSSASLFDHAQEIQIIVRLIESILMS